GVLLLPDLRHDLLEVVQLPDVDLVAERDVDAPYPPVVGKAEGEVATLLSASPAADGGGVVAELRGEGRESVVPVVIAGDEEQFPLGLGLEAIGGERPIVGVEAAPAVLLDGGVGIGEIAAEDEDLPGRQRLVLTLYLEAIGRQQAGHGIGGLEAVAEIGDEV